MAFRYCYKVPLGWLNPTMKLGFIAAPVVALYSPIVPAKKLVTNTLPPENAYLV